MLFLKEAPNTVCFLEERTMELNEKFGGIDVVSTCLVGLPIKELIFKVDSLEERATQSNSLERGGSSESSVAHMEVSKS